MAKDVSKYPEGSYGAYLEQLANELREKVQAVQRMKADPKWEKAFRRTGLSDNPDKIVKDMYQLQNDAAEKLVAMSKLREQMERLQMNLSDNCSVGIWGPIVNREAPMEAKETLNRALFQPNAVDNTAKLLGLSGKYPPSPDRILRNYDEYREAYQEISQKPRESEETVNKRMEAAKTLLEELKESQQKSTAGKLKTFFVGNSKEYKNALEALENLAKGGDPAPAKRAIRDYLDLRGDKVRDHQYGRDRFDAMMKGMKLLMRPKEFENFCTDLTEARQYRSKGAYKGKVDPADYDITPREKAPEVDSDEVERQKDIRRIEEDALRLGGMGREMSNFFIDLRNAKEATPELESYLLRHPGVRNTAREIVEQTGLSINIPKTPTGLGEDLTEKLQAQEQKARSMAGLPPKVRETQDTTRQRGGGPQMS